MAASMRQSTEYSAQVESYAVCVKAPGTMRIIFGSCGVGVSRNLKQGKDTQKKKVIRSIIINNPAHLSGICCILVMPTTIPAVTIILKAV